MNRIVLVALAGLLLLAEFSSAGAQEGLGTVVCVGSELESIASAGPVRRVIRKDVELVYRAAVEFADRDEIEAGLREELGQAEVRCTWSEPGSSHVVVVSYAGVIPLDLTIDPDDPRFQGFSVGYGTDWDGAEENARLDARFNTYYDGSGYEVIVREQWSVGGARAVARDGERHRAETSRALVLNDPRRGELGAGLDDSAEIWTFQGTAGQTIAASVTSDDFDTRVELFSPNGEPIDVDDDGGAGLNSLLVVGLPSSGSFRFRVTETNLTGGPLEGGGYEILVRPETIRQLSLGTTSTGVIESGGSDVGVWTFEGSAEDILAIMVNSDLMDPFIDLFSPTGVWVDGADDSGLDTDALVVARLPFSGQYQLRVHALGNDGGEYEILTGILTELPVTTTMRGDLGDGTVWAFDGDAGQRVVIDVRSDEFDTYVDLNPAFEVDEGFGDDDGGEGLNSRLEVELPYWGWYLIVVADVDGGGSGEYQIALSLTDSDHR